MKYASAYKIQPLLETIFMTTKANDQSSVKYVEGDKGINVIWEPFHPSTNKIRQ